MSHTLGLSCYSRTYLLLFLKVDGISHSKDVAVALNLKSSLDRDLTMLVENDTGALLEERSIRLATSGRDDKVGIDLLAVAGGHEALRGLEVSSELVDVVLVDNIDATSGNRVAHCLAELGRVGIVEQAIGALDDGHGLLGVDILDFTSQFCE
jgi:hypothetical protein